MIGFGLLEIPKTTKSMKGGSTMTDLVHTNGLFEVTYLRLTNFRFCVTLARTIFETCLIVFSQKLES